jgi:pimeloyl-ACP methyl ester carboxylesterase
MGLASAAVAALSALPAWAATAPPKLVLVHGRSQQGLDPAALKTEWLNTLQKGADANGKSLPADLEVAFPYYGDKLDELSREAEVPLTSDIHTRGGSAQDEFLAFQAEVAESVRQNAGVTDAQVDAEYGANPKARGPLNWEWVQAIMRAIDKHGGGMSQNALELFTRDVFLYTTRAGVREEIDGIVAAALTVQPTVVVGHSLGSVVAYSVLVSDPRPLRVPLYVTVGCPLAIRAIRDQFRPLKFPLPVKSWYNAFDTRDVVALNPLDRSNFPVNPDVVNYPLVRNQTDNRHGIVGYLNDREVAKRILAGLVGT